MGGKYSKKPYFKAGMFLLETLTAGMYNDPMSIYREYIQNAVDSVDSSIKTPTSGQLKINIDLDPIKRTLTISDNGVGIPAKKAEKILGSLGSSEKAGTGLRGFRGIGRLGGIAFSEKATFRAKARGETKESVQIWDCEELRKLLSYTKRGFRPSLEKIFAEVTKFYQENGKKPEESYFKVILEGVSSFRNHSLDIQKVRNYLSQVAPVPFDSEKFSYATLVTDYLSQKLSHYTGYRILLNGEPVYKPYRDNLKVTKKDYDYIEGIEVFEIRVRNRPVAYGWYGRRKELLGAISKRETCAGLRVRIGDILLGDAHLLDRCFREPRFNSYIIGEVHIDSQELIPNSRRDDFVDNEMKTLFYNEIEKVVGLPISKDIRYRSRLSSRRSPYPKGLRTKNVEGTNPNEEQTRIEEELPIDKRVISEILRSCKRCPKLQEILCISTGKKK